MDTDKLVLAFVASTATVLAGLIVGIALQSGIYGTLAAIGIGLVLAKLGQ